MSEKIDIRARNIARDKEVFFIIIEESKQQEDNNPKGVLAPNNRASE